MDYDQVINDLDDAITAKEDEIEKIREAKTLLEQLRDGADGGAPPPKKAGPSAPARRALIAARACKDGSNGTPKAKLGKRRTFDDATKKSILAEYWEDQA